MVSAQTHARQTTKMLESQLVIARQLVAKQDGFLQGKLLEAANKKDASPTEAKLFSATLDFVRAQHDKSKEEQRKIEAAIAQQGKEMAAASSRRQLTLRSVRAEFKALTVANEHRQQFLKEKKAFLAAAEREEAEAAQGMRSAHRTPSPIRMHFDTLFLTSRHVGSQVPWAARRAWTWFARRSRVLVRTPRRSNGRRVSFPESPGVPTPRLIPC